MRRQARSPETIQLRALVNVVFHRLTANNLPEAAGSSRTVKLNLQSLRSAVATMYQSPTTPDQRTGRERWPVALIGREASIHIYLETARRKTAQLRLASAAFVRGDLHARRRNTNTSPENGCSHRAVCTSAAAAPCCFATADKQRYSAVSAGVPASAPGTAGRA